MLNKIRPNFKILYILSVLMIFIAGLGIRLFDLTNPPLDFHPSRQIHSAIIARGFYAFMPNHMEGFERDKAWSFSSELWIEPPILEYITALSYVVAGDSYLWIARIYSIIFWSLGGLALLFLMQSLVGKGGAFTALLFYMILPYGIQASRSFQPDPLMVALMLFSLWMLIRWRTSHSWQDALLTGLFTGLAILVKQVAVFFIGSAIAVVLLTDWGFTRSIRSLKVWSIALLALSPAIIYNVYGLFISGFLKTQYSMRFFPSLFSDPIFYYRWASKINLTTGWVTFLLALAGILFLKGRGNRCFLTSLFTGYFVYGLTFAYHISTHDYYQEPLIPLVAIGIGAIAEIVWAYIQSNSNKWGTYLVVVLITAGCLFTLFSVRNEMKRVDYRDQPALWSRLGSEFKYGKLPVIGLFDDYGVRLMYWGDTMPAVWESTGDVKMQELAGHPQNIKDIYSRLEGKYYFIVTDFAELDNQTDLKKVLETFLIYEKGKGYTIYDLSHPLNNDSSGTESGIR